MVLIVKTEGQHKAINTALGKSMEHRDLKSNL